MLSRWGDWCPKFSALAVWASRATWVDNCWCVAYFLVGRFVFAIFQSFRLSGFVRGVLSVCCRGVAFANFPSNLSQVRFSCSSIVLALVPLIVVPHH